MSSGEGNPILKGPEMLSPGKANEVAENFGPEIGIAEKLAARFPSDDIVLVKLSWGGTALQGAPTEPVWLDGALYTDWFIPQLTTAFQRLGDKAKFPNGFVVSGIFWMQGESDASFFEKSGFGNYSSALKKFVQDRLRVELARIPGTGSYIEAPFVYSLIRPHWLYATMIQREQRMAQYKIPASKCVTVGKTAEVYAFTDPVNVNLGYNLNHYNARGILEVGRGMGEAMVKFLDGDRTYGCPMIAANKGLFVE